MKRLLFLFIFVFGFQAGAEIIASGELLGEKYRAEKIAADFRIPWGFDFISEKEILLTERRGNMFLMNLETGARKKISGLPEIAVTGQGGLLDIKLASDYAKSKRIYFSYSSRLKSGKYTTNIATGILDRNQLKNLKVLFSAQPGFSQSHHFGSRIVFDGKGHLFFSVGDRGNRDLAQSLDTDNGKIHRIKLDGSIPADNPFKDKKGQVRSIWSFGHRNPQGLFYDRSSEKLWEQEHGPKGGDEINLISAGKNYGWPIITYGKEYSGWTIGDGLTKQKGMEQPVKYFVPSIAPSGLMVYSGKLFPKWKGVFFSGALVLKHINIVVIKKDRALGEHRLFKELRRRIRNVGEAPDGSIYFSSDSGEIFRILK